MLLNTCSRTPHIFSSFLLWALFFLLFYPGMLSSSHFRFFLLHLFTFCRLALSLTSASVFSCSLPLFSFHLHLYSFIIFPFCSHALQFLHLSSEISFCSTPFTSFFSFLAISCCSSLSYFSVCSFSSPFYITSSFYCQLIFICLSGFFIPFVASFPPLCSSLSPVYNSLDSFTLSVLMGEFYGWSLSSVQAQNETFSLIY